jgi:DNA polymerase-3 subunit epsilon
LPVGEAPFAFVDLEMTGLDTENDRVVEVCVDRVVGSTTVALFHSLIDPGERIGGASHVHGIDQAAVKGAPTFAAVADEVLASVAGAIVVAHAAVWDVRFLAAECRRAARTLNVDYWLDTLVLSRRAFAFHSYSLDALCRELGIDRGRAHRAQSDVQAMRVLFEKCVGLLRPLNARDLWEVRVGDRRARQVILDACEAAAKHGAPVILTYRPAKRPPDSFLMVVQGVRSDLDPPRVVGYQLPGRGRKDLRADRILRVEPAPSQPPLHRGNLVDA